VPPHDDTAAALRSWFASRLDAYPWRGPAADPYAVLVSEAMLQQTQASRVIPAFTAFLVRFPTVRSLAAASRADVLRAWAGLGYNRRAVALHEAARRIRDDHGGRVPREIASLRALPGVGPYTASAVASIAFGEPVAAVDVNVRRVTARFLRAAEPAELSAAEAAADAAAWLDRDTPGEWNQSVMDLGREVCRPVPRCDRCPLALGCSFRASGRRAVPGGRRKGRFEGSRRQVRGRVVAVLRDQASADLRTLAHAAAVPAERVRQVLEALVRDGLVEPVGRGRFRLPA
jgi:A/G-specific adenine glycosylase